MYLFQAKRQTISATAGGTLDLSGLTAVMGPNAGGGTLNFVLNGAASTLNLDNLQTIDSIGPTRFSVSGVGSSLSLPNLTDVAQGEFYVTQGASLHANGASWTYSSTSFTGGGTLFSVADADSLLDLSALQSINAKFNPSCCDPRTQTISSPKSFARDTAIFAESTRLIWPAPTPIT